MTKRAAALLGAAAAVAWTACTPPEGAEADRRVEFVYERHGGLCASAEGGGGICRYTVTVTDDGTWTAAGFPGPDTTGVVPPGAATDLAVIFDAGWRGLTAQPFEGTCPVAYDGQEVVYRVSRIPIGPGAELADASVREVRSCTHDLTHSDAELQLRQIQEAWETFELPN